MWNAKYNLTSSTGINRVFRSQISRLQMSLFGGKSFRSITILPESGHARKFIPRSDCAILRQTWKKRKPRATSQTLQASVSMLNVKVYDSSVRKRLNKYGLFRRVTRSKPQLSKKNMAVELWFAKLQLNKPQVSWNNVLWSDETKIEMFGDNAQSHIWQKSNMANQHRHLIPTVSTVMEGWWFGLVLHPQDQWLQGAVTVSASVSQGVLVKWEATCVSDS